MSTAPSTAATNAIGMVGLGVMGRNLAYNLADHGHPILGTDAWPEAITRFEREKGSAAVQSAPSIKDLVAHLARPRRIIVLVKAGEVTEQTLAQLLAVLEPGDLVVDGGNEHFETTERRAQMFAAKQVHFFGMGVSGGESGARRGPALMPGGDSVAYGLLKDALESIAATHSDGPCVTYCGPGGAGHYVKMVHNGIEYADMQLLAETYALLKHVGGLSNVELADTFARWNEGPLASYLVEITAAIFRKQDDLASGQLVDAILDKAAQKGTGKWTLQDAATLGCPIPTIVASVDARLLAARKIQRQTLHAHATHVAAPGTASRIGALALAPSERGAFVEDVERALYAAKILAYAQGFDLLHHASLARNWNLPFAELARIWQAGCIIRAKVLTQIRTAFLADPSLEHLLLSPALASAVGGGSASLRGVVSAGAQRAIAVPGLASALGYYDTIRTERLPANLTQAQRDFFGAHGYERVDREGTFHTQWL
jgi:6-phosphogluconate dehydrogenase